MDIILDSKIPLNKILFTKTTNFYLNRPFDDSITVRETWKLGLHTTLLHFVSPPPFFSITFHLPWPSFLPDFEPRRRRRSIRNTVTYCIKYPKVEKPSVKGIDIFPLELDPVNSGKVGRKLWKRLDKTGKEKEVRRGGGNGDKNLMFGEPKKLVSQNP